MRFALLLFSFFALGFLSPSFASNKEKQAQLEELFQRFENQDSASGQLQAIQDIDDFFNEEGNKPSQIYANDKNMRDQLHKRVEDLIRKAPFIDNVETLEKFTDLEEDIWSPRIKAFKLLRFFPIKERKNSIEKIDPWLWARLLPLMSSVSDIPIDTSSENGIYDILGISEVWSYNQLIPSTYNNRDRPLPPGIKIYVEIIHRLEAQDIVELLKRAKTPEENYFVMALVATSYFESVEAQMVPRWDSEYMVPEVSDEAIFAMNFQDSTNYTLDESSSELRWLENQELRKKLENLSRSDSVDPKLYKEPNSFSFVPLNAVRILSYGGKTESTTEVIDEFMASIEKNEPVVWSQLTDPSISRYDMGLYFYLYSKFHLAFSYITYHGWEGIPRVIEWISALRGMEKGFLPRDIAGDLMELVGDMAYIDISPKHHSYYFDFFSEMFKQCHLHASFVNRIFEKGLKNISQSENVDEFRNGFQEQFQEFCESN